MMEEIAKLVVAVGFKSDNIGKTDSKLLQQTTDIAHQFGVIKEEAFTNNTKIYEDFQKGKSILFKPIL